jgi:predicted metal-binding membrane protein
VPAAAASRRLRERPEAWLYALSAACWAVLILAPAEAAAAAFCLGGARIAGLAFAFGPALAGIEWPSALSHWLLMIGAMMPPMAAMAVRHVAARSFRHRRRRAMAVFMLGYGAVWMVAGPLYLAAGLAADLLSRGSLLVPVAAAIAVAALWQAMPAKRRALRQCHRTVPLAASGWQADRDCLAYGLAHGRACLLACWALMLIPAAAAHHPLPMLLVALIALGERRALAAEPVRGVADAWERLAGLAPSLRR